MRSFAGIFSFLAMATSLGCGGDPSTGEAKLPPLGPRDAGGFPRYSEAFQIATHNSYWVNRGAVGDAFASGVGERLSDQLLADHARGVEIDIHRDDNQPQGFRVYHTVPGNSLCDTLAECLGVLRAFHRALPEHEAVIVILELKEVTASNFDADHTAEDLDRILSDELGALLYRPSELLAPCEPHGVKGLSACVEKAAWPSIKDLRGRFLVAVLGNWDAIGAQATKDWVDYATKGDIHARAAFPMASSWKLDEASLPPAIEQMVTQADLDAAFAQSVLLQAEDQTDPLVPPFLEKNGAVRIDNAFTADAQASVVAAGMQLIQSDTPWIQVDDRGPREPLRPLAMGAPDLVEPGERLALSPGAADERVFAYAMEPMTAVTTWETTVSSGHDVTSVGCLRAASEIGGSPAKASITACRRKVSGMGTQDAERTFIDVEVCEQGACAVSHVPSEDASSGGPGDTLSFAVDSHESGMSCVTVLSARLVERDLSPRWAKVGDPFCVGAALPYQGIARPPVMGAGGSVYFFGTTRTEGGAAAASVREGAFAGVAVEPLAGGVKGAPMNLTDLSTP